MHEAYEPVMDDGRGRFPEDLRVKTPRGARSRLELSPTWGWFGVLLFALKIRPGCKQFSSLFVAAFCSFLKQCNCF
jgi:hypothetical protein